MASPKTENGHARIANELIRCALTKVNLSSYEWRVFWAVVSITLSWQNCKGAYKSYRDLAHISGLDIRHTHRAVRGLVSKFILLTREGHKKTWFEINQDYETWHVDNLSVKGGLFESVLPIQATVSVADSGNAICLKQQSLKQQLKQADTDFGEKLSKADFEAFFKSLTGGKVEST